MTLLPSERNKRTTRLLYGALAVATVVIALVAVVGIMFLVGYLKMPAVASIGPGNNTSAAIPGLSGDKDPKKTNGERASSIQGRNSEIVGPSEIFGSSSEAADDALLKSLLVQTGYISAKDEVTKRMEPAQSSHINGSISPSLTSSLVSDKTQTVRPTGGVALAKMTPTAEETAGGTVRGVAKAVTPLPTTAGRAFSANSNSNSNSASNSLIIVGQQVLAGVPDAELEAQIKQLYPGGYQLDRPWEAQKWSQIRQPTMDELTERHILRPAIEGYQYGTGKPELPFIARNISVVFDEPEIVSAEPIKNCPYEVAPKICQYRRENRILNAGKCDKDHPCQDVASTCCYLECHFMSVCVHKSFIPVVLGLYL